MISTSPWSAALGRSALRVAVVLLCASPSALRAQAGQEITEELLRRVMPEANRLGPREGEPPVYRAYSVDSLTARETHIGFVFLTSDIPPETPGYTAPIRTLVGMDLQGKLTGARVVSYRESLRSSRGDFLARPGIQGQFTGKDVTDAFRVRQDVESITGATITVSAMAVGVRNAARRVAATYMMGATRAEAGPVPRLGTIPLEELDRFTWPEMVQLELVREIVADVGGSELLRVSIAYLRDDAMAEAIIGSTRFPDAIRRARERSPDGHLVFLGLNGPNIVFFRPETISFVQGADTVRVAQDDFVSTGLLPNGKARGEFRRTGLLVVDRSLDVTRPFTAVIDVGDPAGFVSGDYSAYDEPPSVAAGADAPAPPEGVAGGPAAPDDPSLPEGGILAAGAGAPDAVPSGGGGGGGSEAATGRAGDASAAGVSSDQGGGASGTVAGSSAAEAPASSAFQMDFSDQELADFLFPQEEEGESVLSRTLAQTSWTRVGWLLALLAVVTWAFAAKSVALRWVALAGTLGFLGFVDRGFLSVSHILAGISVGPDVYLGDLSLLILVSFTVLTTLFFGRVFCGFLCPFGALQDLLERIVPRRFRRELPRSMHERALYLKYGVLAVVLAPAVLGIPITVFHFFEPFGTVFYWSPSVLLWAIALAILIASAVVPRFYCRYACPLGAALALGSLLSPFRIRRVEQCTVCTVCERVCPTGAIRGPDIDFKECVRCNECEIQLLRRTGVCRHDMEEIRPRLVMLTTASSRNAS